MKTSQQEEIKMKKFLNIFISLNLIFHAGLFADVIEECATAESADIFPMGDDTGKSIFTKRNVTVDCNLTIDVQGPCIKWEEEDQQFNLEPDNYNTYRSQDNSGSIGSLFATVGAYDQLEHLWSGWKGYCESGTKHDFSWASDPMYWASLAASAFMDASAEGQLLDGAFDASTSAAQSGLQSVFASIGVKLSQNMASCLVASGIDLAFAGASAMLEEDEPPCDPVDEFCAETDSMVDEEDIFTLTVQEYDNLLNEHPEAANYLVLIKTEGNVVSLRYITPAEVGLENVINEADMKAIEDDIKEMMLYINAAIAVGKLAMCGVTGQPPTGPEVQQDNDGRFSVENGVSMAINSIPADWLGPYGFLLKAAAQVLLSVLTSFKDIDSCKNEDDAREEGTRHLKTYESLQYDLCHHTSTICAQEEIFGSGCSLDGFNYCCYDQLLTKILVEQLKAQLGRDWTHCTGISIDDLQHVSFRECDDVDKTYGFDGADYVNKVQYLDETPVIHDPTQSYQYVRKCIDLTEFKEHIKNIFNESIDISDFEQDMKDLNEAEN